MDALGWVIAPVTTAAIKTLMISGRSVESYISVIPQIKNRPLSFLQ
jgi:hypothetical protein